MLFTDSWWAHALGWGAVATGLSGAVLITALLIGPYGFLSDYPDDIQRRAPVPTRRQRITGLIGGLAFVVVLFASIVLVVMSWGWSHPDAGFVEFGLMALVVMVLFALFDLVIIDWLIICTWRPQRLVFPGTENCAGWGDYLFHVKEQLAARGIALLLGSSVVIGLLAMWIS